MTMQTPRGSGQNAIVDAIRSAIIAGDLAPGQRLVEAELCDLLGTSRGTLRAALADLQHEGLVERIANRGARVRIVGLTEALEVVEVRMTLELLCIERAAKRINDQEIAYLQDLGKALLVAADKNDSHGFARLTNEIFTTYVRIADHAIATEMLDRLRDRMARHRLRLTYRPGRAQTAAPFWIDIIDALANRDADAAAKAIRAHSLNVRDTMIALSTDTNPFAKI